KDGEIPVLQSGTPNNVSPRIAEGEWNCVVHESAGVKQRTWDARFAIGIADEVWPHIVESHAPPAVAGRDIGQRIGDGKPIAGLRGYDARDLPVSDDLIEHAGRASAEGFAVAKGKLVNVAEHEAMPHVEIGVAIFEIRIPLIAEVAIVERPEVCAGSVIFSVRVSIGSLKLHTMREVLFPTHL